MTVKGLFVNAKQTLDLAAGDVVFQAGDLGEEMYGVISGTVELRRDGVGVTQIGAEGTFGELAIIEHAPRSLTAVAIEPSQVAVIDKRTFLYLVHETPTFAIQVMSSLAARIRQLDARG